MDGSHPVNDQLRAELGRLNWLRQDPQRNRDEIAYSLTRLTGIVDSGQLPPPEQVELLQRIGGIALAGDVAPRWLPQIELAVALRLIALGEAQNGVITALVPVEVLAFAYERSAAILIRHGQIAKPDYRRRLNRAKQLRSPHAYAVKQFAKEVARQTAINYLNSRAAENRRRRLSR